MELMSYHPWKYQNLCNSRLNQYMNYLFSDLKNFSCLHLSTRSSNTTPLNMAELTWNNTGDEQVKQNYISSGNSTNPIPKLEDRVYASNETVDDHKMVRNYVNQTAKSDWTYLNSTSFPVVERQRRHFDDNDDPARSVFTNKSEQNIHSTHTQIIFPNRSSKLLTISPLYSSKEETLLNNSIELKTGNVDKSRELNMQKDSIRSVARSSTKHSNRPFIDIDYLNVSAEIPDLICYDCSGFQCPREGYTAPIRHLVTGARACYNEWNERKLRS